MKTYPIGPWGYLHVVMIIDMYMDPSRPAGVGAIRFSRAFFCLRFESV